VPECVVIPRLRLSDICSQLRSVDWMELLFHHLELTFRSTTDRTCPVSGQNVESCACRHILLWLADCFIIHIATNAASPLHQRLTHSIGRRMSSEATYKNKLDSNGQSCRCVAHTYRLISCEIDLNLVWRPCRQQKRRLKRHSMK